MKRGARPKSLVLILTRDLASLLATPAFLVDEEGTLVYYNEAAERVLGKSFAEAGEMPRDEWVAAFRPTALDGSELPVKSTPLGIALLERRPAHGRLMVTGIDEVRREISATSLPLFSHEDEFEGALALFWEEEPSA
jgi:PAS domain-containing protein